MKFGTGVHAFCWEVGVFNRSCFCPVSCNRKVLPEEIHTCNTKAQSLLIQEEIHTCNTKAQSLLIQKEIHTCNTKAQSLFIQGLCSMLSFWTDERIDRRTE